MPNDLHFETEAEAERYWRDFYRRRNELEHRKSVSAAAMPAARAYMIGGRQFSPEEVAHLRSLPDAEIAALQRAGRRDEWYVAISKDEQPAEEPTSTKAAVPAAAAQSKWVTWKSFNAVAGKMAEAVRVKIERVASTLRATDEALEKRVRELERAMADGQRDAEEKSIKRQLSRHADHLGRIEDRVRKLEGK